METVTIRLTRKVRVQLSGDGKEVWFATINIVLPPKNVGLDLDLKLCLIIHLEGTNKSQTCMSCVWTTTLLLDAC